MKAGADLGMHMEVTKELLCLDHNTSEGQARILELQNEHSTILQMKDNTVSDALASADKYKTLCEEQMWKVLTTSNVRYDKAVHAGFEYPQVVEPSERKATLLFFRVDEACTCSKEILCSHIRHACNGYSHGCGNRHIREAEKDTG